MSASTAWPISRRQGPCAGLVVAVGLTALGTASLRPRAAEAPLRKFTLSLRQESGDVVFPAVSPDGRQIAYLLARRLWVRDLSQITSRALAEGLDEDFRPLWSLDGQFIVFATSSGISRVAVANGAISPICAVGDFTGGSGGAWTPDGRILFAKGEDHLYEVAAGGGVPAIFLAREDSVDADLHHPYVLPGGRGVLYVRHLLQGGPTTLALAERGKRHDLLRLPAGLIWQPVYDPRGFIIFSRIGEGAGLWALPFTLDGLKVTGEPFLIAPDGGSPSVDADGSLVYRLGTLGVETRVVRVDRSGAVLETLTEPRLGNWSMALSPDEKLLAVETRESGEGDLWLYDLERKAQTRFAFGPSRQGEPTWSPDGRELAWGEFGQDRVLVRPTDGSQAPRPLVRGYLPQITADGRHVVYVKDGAITKSDIWYSSIGAAADGVPLITTPAAELHPHAVASGGLPALRLGRVRQAGSLLASVPHRGRAVAGVDQRRRAGALEPERPPHLLLERRGDLRGPDRGRPGRATGYPAGAVRPGESEDAELGAIQHPAHLRPEPIPDAQGGREDHREPHRRDRGPELARGVPQEVAGPLRSALPSAAARIAGGSSLRHGAEMVRAPAPTPRQAVLDSRGFGDRHLRGPSSPEPAPGMESMNRMSVELSALAFQGIVTLLLLLVYYGLWRQSRRPYDLTWAGAWGIYALRLGFISAYIVTRRDVWLFLHQTATGLSALLLLYAALQFSQSVPGRRRYYALGALVVLWSYVAVFVIHDFMIGGLSSAVLLSGVTLWTGIVFWRYRRRVPSVGATILAWNFSLWSLHHLDYPLIRALGTGVLLGVYIDIVFIAATAIGALYLVLGREQRMLESRNQQLEQLTGLLLTAQEEERRRIARELHDEAGQILTAVKIDLDLGGRKESAEMVGRAIAQMRNLSNLLRPQVLDLGLLPAIRSLTDDFSARTQVRTTLSLPESLSGIAPERQVAIYRIAQEALTNVARHAGATRVHVVLDREDDHVALTVEDDGRGPSGELRPHLGLLGMRERVTALGGTLAVGQGNDRGFRIAARIPLGGTA